MNNLDNILDDTSLNFRPVKNPASNCYKCEASNWKCSFDLCQGDQWKWKFNIDNFRQKYKNESFRSKPQSKQKAKISF